MRSSGGTGGSPRVRGCLAALLLCGASVACGAPDSGDLAQPAGEAGSPAAQAPEPPGSRPEPASPPSPARLPAPAPAATRPTPPSASGAPPPTAAPEPAAPLDLAGLERRLRANQALGPLTKLALKNDIEDLMADVRVFHATGRGDLARLRERFELLVMKLLSLLQDRESELAAEIARSRDALWALLSDPRAFAQLSDKN